MKPDRETRAMSHIGVPLLLYMGTIGCGIFAYDVGPPMLKVFGTLGTYAFAWMAMQYNQTVRSRLRRIDPEGSRWYEHRQAIRNHRRAEAHRRAVAAGTITEPDDDARSYRTTRSGLVESTGDAPITAWKRYPLVWGGDRLTLTSAIMGMFNPVSLNPFDGGVWVDAECPSLQLAAEATLTALIGADYKHAPTPPDERCTCGFYATSDLANATYNGVLVEVELAGRVIVAESGYRAQHMRITAIHAPTCWVCNGVASALWVDSDGNPGPAAWLDPRPLGARVRSACLEHAPAVPLHSMDLLKVFDVPILESTS